MKSLFLSINLMLCIGISAFSSNGSIRGKITDQETGEGLIGTSILVQGTTVKHFVERRTRKAPGSKTAKS